MRQSSSRSELLRAVQETGFACLDLNLYLDNHPEDKKAVNTYNSLYSQFAKARCNYESKYGPLTNFGYSPSSYPWQWVCEPWPWDREFND
ncbi:spore coat protein CotJB [Romboutsia maritimum]|uniref:Spore coat protein CotJB n=1 Tax=Romboutsia maritimum TaxID=2020948 RepID=A0A371IQC0_9FIRM|nr:spore coat protein CotJB [Romboutsia maritimum]RDY22668.1 spore coat protein CotJB [Romboutsia maritimum]